ncbi:DUF2284 domain-containing protein [Thermincola potens]|uniref:O-methyltransferase family 2 n=1 Tax=Thermincola potens (strain JR) TaxID=635013 RepID=D5XBA4_THEPJ|nr:DUF2284 domain-containing protein [Thermincola potens]ADG81424.1 Protein of unknown function DUF2284, metal-binding protein [Thermincola potens JR]
MHQGANRPGPQYLEDLATGYWFSEVLFTAVELDIFTHIERGGKSVEEISEILNCRPAGMERFLQALCAMGLLINYGEKYYNTGLASEYLVAGKENYQGDSILWRKYLVSRWQDLASCLRAGGRVNYGASEEDPAQRAHRIRMYISAMDRVARTKVQEIMPFFAGLSMSRKILDVGAGSGAIAAGFLKRFPAMTATLLDLPEVLSCTQEFMQAEKLVERITFSPTNILEDWPVDTAGFDLVILSNIIHAYSEKEITGILQRASDCLKTDGLLVIHDFFLEHYPEKAALFDLNMFINTYNGKVFSCEWVMQELARLNLYKTELIPLKTDTALIIAGKNKRALARLHLQPVDRLVSSIKTLGFDDVCPVSTDMVHVTDWADLKCRFGCSGYGKGHCPPNSLPPQKTRDLLKDYSRALLLKGQPPTRDFQRRVLQAEREAFKAGFHKAFVFWAGPCSLCDSCATDGKCRNTRDARPSMEGAGIDVFATVRRAGFHLEVLQDKNDFVTYFALLLLE